MRILDKYILLKTIKGYFCLLFLFSGLFIIIDTFSNLESFLKNSVTFLEIVNYYFFSLPFIFLKVSAFSLLISSIYLFGELNKNNELIGMRIAGLSILRIILPVLTFSLTISLFSLFIQEKVLLFSQKKIEKTKLKLIRNKKIPTKENLAFRYQNMIFFVSTYLPEKNMLKDVIIFKENVKGEIEEKIIAKRITNKNNQWEAENVIIYPLNKNFSPLYKKTLSLNIKKVSFEDIIMKKSVFSQLSSLKDIYKERERLKKIKAKRLVEHLTIQYHEKLCEPFSHLFLVIGVLPFALEIRKRKVGLVSFGMGFFFSFIYYVIFSISLALGKAGIILPFLSCWVAPLFFIILGVSGLFFIK
ncbi:MAG: hypothetical protein B6D55_04600 [Candidatus Omnitrophica bacterium 4484_70.2]|nr:MAG: hypothetical protein B6D55_04600 [Candidatus Omnitrophica bacterium 4484_70.2]